MGLCHHMGYDSPPPPYFSLWNEESNLGPYSYVSVSLSSVSSANALAVSEAESQCVIPTGLLKLAVQTSLKLVIFLLLPFI